MKISKSQSFSICLITGLFFITQFSIANQPILLPPDDSPKTPPSQTDGATLETSASATISETDLDVYFDFPVGNATIKVYDAGSSEVYEETVNTNTVNEVNIPVSTWQINDYMITVTYRTIIQRGYFSIE